MPLLVMMVAVARASNDDEKDDGDIDDDDIDDDGDVHCMADTKHLFI